MYVVKNLEPNMASLDTLDDPMARQSCITINASEESLQKILEQLDGEIRSEETPRALEEYKGLYASALYWANDTSFFNYLGMKRIALCHAIASLSARQIRELEKAGNLSFQKKAHSHAKTAVRTAQYILTQLNTSPAYLREQILHGTIFACSIIRRVMPNVLDVSTSDLEHICTKALIALSRKNEKGRLDGQALLRFESAKLLDALGDKAGAQKRANEALKIANDHLELLRSTGKIEEDRSWRATILRIKSRFNIES